MNQLLLSVLLATAAVLTGGAVLLLGLISMAAYERNEDEAGFVQKMLCRFSFDRVGCCDPAGKAG